MPVYSFACFVSKTSKHLLMALNSGSLSLKLLILVWMPQGFTEHKTELVNFIKDGLVYEKL
jgi:hypothetical protein